MPTQSRLGFVTRQMFRKLLKTFHCYFVTALLLFPIASQAEGYCGWTYGVTVILKDGSQHSGYVSWCDGGNNDSGNFSPFRYPSAPLASVAANFPRRLEVPKNACYQCSDNLFQLWAEFQIWVSNQGLTPTARNGLELLGEIETVVTEMPLEMKASGKIERVPLTVTAIVQESIRRLPWASIHSVRTNPAQQLKIQTCLPTLTRHQIGLLKSGPPLHVLRYTSALGGMETLFFFHDQIGPQAWLEDQFLKTSMLPDMSVDGHRLWKLYPNWERPDEVENIEVAELPDEPLFQEMAELLNEWVRRRPQGFHAWNAYAKEHFKALPDGALTPFYVSADCD